MKRVITFRHGHAEHNARNDWSIADAPLTTLGREQATAISRSDLGAHANARAELLVASPLRRTLQTTVLGFSEARQRIPTVVMPELQEWTSYACDTGSSKAVLQADSEFASFELGDLPDDWTSKAGFWSAEERAVSERARWVRRWLRARPEQLIVVVSHAGFLRWVTTGHNDHSMWENVEGRVWRFRDGDDSTDDEAALERVELSSYRGNVP